MDDETINTPAFIKKFTQLPQTTRKQLIIYTANDPDKELVESADISYRNSAYPSEHIFDFAHTAIHHSPENPHYGRNPDYYDYLHYACAPAIHSKPDYLGAINAKNLRHPKLCPTSLQPRL